MIAREPVFVVGTGRCGSSALFRELSRHPDLGWPSSLLDRWPGATRANRALNDLAHGRMAFRWLPGASEAYPWWDVHAPGFSVTRRDLVASDLTPTVARAVREAVRGLCSRRRPFPVLKITGWPRIGFLRAIFPEARFVHLVRDGRAVAASLVQRRWWDGWEGPPTWRMGDLGREMASIWEAHHRSPVVLAAIQWWVLMEHFQQAASHVPPDSYVEIRYESLCQEPRREMERIVGFAGWRWPPSFESIDWSARFRGEVDGWRSSLYPEQVDALEEVLAGPLARFGYPTGS